MTANFRQVRNTTYQYHASEAMLEKFGADPNNWKEAPYTFIKSRFYIEGATLVTYFFLKMKNQCQLYYTNVYSLQVFGLG